MWIGWSHPAPPLTRVQISFVPYLGAAETRPKSAASVPPRLSVSMPQGPKNGETGALGVWAAARLNSNTRVRASGIADRSGFGISVAGTWLTSGLAGLRTTRNSRNLPTQGSGEVPRGASAGRHTL